MTVAELDPAQESRRTLHYARDIHQMNLALGKLLQKSGAETAMLVDDTGHLIARQGSNSPTSDETITALVAGTSGTSHALAKLLGADEFSTLVPRGGGGNLMILRAGANALLALGCGDQLPIALVRTYALETIRRVRPLLDHPEP